LKKKVIITLVVLAALIIGLQSFFAYGLTRYMRKLAQPALKELLNLDVKINRVSLNLLRGAVCIHGIRISNPTGFHEPDLVTIRRFSLDIGVVPLLLHQTIVIEEVDIKDAVLFVIRNKDGQINIRNVRDTFQFAVANTSSRAIARGHAKDKAHGTIAERLKSAGVKVDKIRINSLINYVDHYFPEEPFELGVKLDIRFKDIVNYCASDVMSGTINLHGNILIDKTKSAFEVTGRITPVHDPNQMSFVLSGSIQPISLKAFKPFLAKYGIEDGSASGTINLLCDKGVFDSDKSAINLRLDNIFLKTPKQMNMQPIRLMESSLITVPVGGTLMNPRVDDLVGAITQNLVNDEVIISILNNVLKTPTETLESLQGKKTGASSKKRKQSKPFDIDAIINDVLGSPEK